MKRPRGAGDRSECGAGNLTFDKEEKKKKAIDLAGCVEIIGALLELGHSLTDKQKSILQRTIQELCDSVLDSSAIKWTKLPDCAVDPYGSPQSEISSTPSATKISPGGSGVLYPRKGAPDRSAALASNIAREEMAGVARQLISQKSINPIIPLTEQPQALTIFRKELYEQYPRYESECGSNIRSWLQAWLTCQRKQAHQNRTKKKNGEIVYLPLKHQEELAAYNAQKEAKKNPVARLPCGAEGGTSSGEPSRLDGAPPTTATPESQLQSVDTTDTVKPCVLTDEDTLKGGDACLLAPRECLDDRKSRETYNAQLATFMVLATPDGRSLHADAFFIYKAIPIPPEYLLVVLSDTVTIAKKKEDIATLLALGNDGGNCLMQTNGKKNVPMNALANRKKEFDQELAYTSCDKDHRILLKGAKFILHRDVLYKHGAINDKMAKDKAAAEAQLFVKRKAETITIEGTIPENMRPTVEGNS